MSLTINPPYPGYRAEWVAVCLTVIDEDGQEVQFNKTVEYTLPLMSDRRQGPRDTPVSGYAEAVTGAQSSGTNAFATPADGGRPLCCGRTFLAAGLVDQARHEARRLIDASRPYVEQGVPVVGLEPACLLTLRDEITVMLPGADTAALAARALLFEEFLAQQAEAGQLNLPLRALPQKHALLHGHCHQKAFGAMGAVERVLGLVPELEVETVASSCCGMAGAFGYEAEHFTLSMAMGELSLLPAVREAGKDTLIVADGTSCREQIRDGAGRDAWHVARVLEAALSKSNGS